MKVEYPSFARTRKKYFGQMPYTIIIKNSEFIERKKNQNLLMVNGVGTFLGYLLGVPLNEKVNIFTI